MLSQLLFECISEEIPPRMQSLAASQIKGYINNIFSKNVIRFSSMEVFVTARRITLFIKNISISEFNSSNNEIKGPNINVQKDVIESFLRKNKKSESDLFIRKVGNAKFFFVKKDCCSFDTQEFFKNLLEEMLKNFSWKRSMRWNEGKEKWIRPIQNILCILDNQIIPVSFAGIKACNLTFGHRFFSNSTAPLIPKTPEHYFSLMESNNVILQRDKRKKIILDQINQFIKEHSLQLEINDHLLNELTGLVEWPIVLFGKVDQEKSSELPRAVILSIINMQQRYLALSNEGRISHFVTVVNINNNVVVRGYEAILEARLADAKFLISQDKRKNLDFYVEKLDSILFHTHLGSVGEKVKRIVTLSKYIAIYVPRASLIKVERAAYLAKADLATSMVREFPELQGTIGGYYASCSEEDDEIIEAITEHYKPIKLEQECAKSPTSISVAIADKIDSLIGLIAINKKISGSYDQFGLRRMAIGVIRTILENSLHIPLKLLIDKSVSLYLESRSVFNMEQFDQFHRMKEKILEVAFKFFLDKFKVILRNEGIKPDVISSILYNNHVDDLLSVKKRAVVLDNYLNTLKGKQILNTYKRVSNIINRAEKNDNTIYSAFYKKKFLIDNKEIALSNSAVIVYKNIKQAIENGCFNIALDELNVFIPFVNQFMDNVKINCDSNTLRKNRLFLLTSVISIFHLVANFDFVKFKK
ncbi:MAG: glycine--tRNA ligase subunit beta [Wolbachia endosymbiont of Meromenopon meropis]|nr:glycine--tRNA ligase subunit beta [Wolbachia endosymbiont of Meromenopon meropis]